MINNRKPKFGSIYMHATLGLLFFSFSSLVVAGQVVENFNGVSFVASGTKYPREHVDAVECHAVSAGMPFGFIRIGSPENYF